MERARRAVFGRRTSAEGYEPLIVAEVDTAPEESVTRDSQDEIPFSWVEYCIFGLLGVAMLWAWNMFLAAAPYFSSRFASNPWIQINFQSGILTVSTVTNLGVLIILSNIQSSASYPFRINLALVMNSIAFALLTASTTLFLDASAAEYYVFLLVVVGFSSWATGLIQNGAFAFAASYGRPEYMQALMAGQGVAGVLPAVAQVTTVLLFPPQEPASSPSVRRTTTTTTTTTTTEDDEHAGRRGESSAFVYFLAAVTISVAALVSLVPLIRRHNRRIQSKKRADHMAAPCGSTTEEAPERAARKATPLWLLFRKLRWLAIGVAVTFAVTMFFPVLTAKIHSVRENDEHPNPAPLFRPTAFIPLGFAFWNLGDLAGRMATMLPCSLHHRRPFTLFLLAVGRVALVPLYLLCNVNGRGAIVPSDAFYLFVVQLVFGLTNGWLGSSFMMASGQWVDEGEREATGGLMSLFLVIGLTVGSLLSFTVSGI
ncbi:hypothetical protein E4U43_001010 [Claviceps pusilla]|uniref:Intracellular membrane protein involved in nucleoside transport n=1 Tax=Claviceps pusilla TaxID=123648 RepID=A0A9P7NAZ3_9HYPO|nr:hypothetical protein E4U43_001010 [Claviceps pusilla]